MTEQQIKKGDALRRRLIVKLIGALSLSKKRMVRWAYRTTELYSRLYADALGGSGDRRRPARRVPFGELPLLTKKIIGESDPFDLLSRKLYWQVFRYGETTGSTGNPPERVARLLTRFRPSVIAATETDFLAWMRVLKDDYPGSYDAVVKALRVLLSTAELCSENRSRQIEKAFDIIHVDNYACVEGFFSLACPCGEKHILPAYETEVLSEALRRSHEFGKGRFAFTNLLRRSTPFIRYLLDDLVTIFPSACPYGFKKSIIPHGRYELSVKIADEQYGTRDFENALFADHLFGEYTVEVRGDRFVVIAEDYGLNDGSIPTQPIQQRFRTNWGLPAELEIVPYGTVRDYKRDSDHQTPSASSLQPRELYPRSPPVSLASCGYWRALMSGPASGAAGDRDRPWAISQQAATPLTMMMIAMP